MSDQIKNDLVVLKNKRIYFGHRSVGNNIMDGLREILGNFPDIQLNIVDIKNSKDFPDYFFAHSLIGENGKPVTKCDAFEEVISSQLLNKIDVSLFKLCFVDIDQSTNVPEVFEYYQKTINLVKEKYPDLIIVHITVPLISGSFGFKKKVKRFFKAENDCDLDNVKRNEYNRLLLKNYSNEPIYDLAKVESTYSNGKRAGFNKDGELYYELIPEYANDGGHLNSLGRKIAAGELIHVLANLDIAS